MQTLPIELRLVIFSFASAEAKRRRLHHIRDKLDDWLKQRLANVYVFKRTNRPFNWYVCCGTGLFVIRTYKRDDTLSYELLKRFSGTYSCIEKIQYRLDPI